MDVFDDRGQALQVGAILLFGILIVGLSLYQATVVPTQNERVEFDTYVDANADVEQLSSGISAAAARDYSTRTAVQTGVRYPTRTVFVNPGPPGNRLRTGEPETIRIANATAVNGEEANTGEYWNGTTREYNTTSVRFDPDYNQLQAPRIIYESGTIYCPTGQTADAPYGPNESIVVSDGTSIEGNRITLVTIAGDLDIGGMSPTVVAQPVSAHTRTVVVEGEGSENITLTVPSQLSADTWEEEIVGDNAHVLDVSQHDDTSVNVTLDGSEAYELRLAKVELRRQSDSSSVASTNPKYVIGVAGDGESISQDQSTKLTAEVRDRYNNPKSGVDVEFSTTNGTLSSGTVTTDAEGRASVQFTPDPGTSGDVTVDATINGGNGDLNTTQFSISVSSGGGGVNNNPNALQVQINDFKKIPGQNEWRIDIQVQDQDGDDDIDRVEWDISDSSGVTRAEGEETSNVGGVDQIQVDRAIDPDDSSYNIQANEKYTLTIRGYDVDGNNDDATSTK
jgi:hypothetical protein